MKKYLSLVIFLLLNIQIISQESDTDTTEVEQPSKLEQLIIDI